MFSVQLVQILDEFSFVKIVQIVDVWFLAPNIKIVDVCFFAQMLNAIFGPLLTLFNMQTPFYMIRIWYLDLKTIYFVVYGELENISANADIRNS